MAYGTKATNDLLYATMKHMERILDEVHDDIQQKHKLYAGWKLLEVDGLIQRYLATAEVVNTFKPHEREAAKKFYQEIPQKAIDLRIQRDIEALRSPQISLARMKHLLTSLEMWKRIGMALVAGLAVIVPMIIITQTFLGDVNASVITVCISTTFFAFFVGWTSNSTHQELLGVVATYAAVLVVFVGVSTQPGQS